MLTLEDCLWPRIYLLETTEGDWKYRGTPIGFTDISCRFEGTDPAVVSAPVTSVQDPGVAAGQSWTTEGGEDELSINWVAAGKVSFNFGVYRVLGYEDQMGFCAPDGALYCFLNGAAQTGTDQADGLVRLTFQGNSASLEFLSAGAGSGYLRDYVGQTYLFQPGGE